MNGSSRCAAHHVEHKAEAQQQTDDRRGNSAARGYDRQWRKAAAEWIDAHPFCVACAAALERRRMVVDHVIPHRGDRALFNDLGNWQTLCWRCHKDKTKGEAAVQIIFVVGPPCSGKTTHVARVMTRGDIVYDYDAVSAALTNTASHERVPGLHDLVMQVRGDVLRHVYQINAITTAWIIQTYYDPAETERLHARVVRLDTPRQTCVERIRAERPSHARDRLIEVVDDWLRVGGVKSLGP